jgi:uracil-DNA glycosylase
MADDPTAGGEWEPVDDHASVDRRFVVEPDCRRCPALVASRTRISWGNGPPDADVVVVGEAPGAGDPAADDWAGGNHTGSAYTSRHSGRRIRDLVADLGYDDRTYYTNAVKCFPAEGITADEAGSVHEDAAAGSTNREPTDEELAACRSHLRSELAAVDPAVVVATGKHATRSLLAVEGKTLDGFLELICEPIDCPTLGVPVVPILHPSYQEVWLSRLDLSEAAYRERIVEHLPS